MEQWNEKQKTISRYFGRLLHLFIGKIFKGTFNGLLFCSGVSILQELLYKICRIILSFVTYCAIYGHITNLISFPADMRSLREVIFVSVISNNEFLAMEIRH